MILLMKSAVRVKGHQRGRQYVREHFRQAAKFAADKHKGQTRKDGKTPYITHPVRVASILGREGGETDPVVMLAALLHDTIEDTDTSYSELAENFGEDVAALVVEVSDDMSRSKMERRASQETKQWSDRAARLKFADKTANMRDLVDAPPVGMSREKKIEYARHAKSVIDGMAHQPEKLRRLFDEAYARVLAN